MFLRLFEKTDLSSNLSVTFRKKLLFYNGLLVPYPTSEAEGPPLVGSSRLFTQHIRSYYFVGF
jgi:hypothetical protein